MKNRWPAIAPSDASQDHHRAKMRSKSEPRHSTIGHVCEIRGQICKFAQLGGDYAGLLRVCITPQFGVLKLQQHVGDFGLLAQLISWLITTKSSPDRVSACAGKSVVTSVMPGCMYWCTISSTLSSAEIRVTTASSLVIGFSGAKAEDWREGAYPYAKQHHRVCQEKAMRLWRFEHAVTADHKLTTGELVVVAALKRDLDNTCSGYRLRRVRELRHGAWRKGDHPYAEQHHRECQDKAICLWRFERSVTADHTLSKGELILVAALKRELDNTCGRYRYRG